MEKVANELKNCRYERKYHITGLEKQQIELLVKRHPSIFSEIYYERFVNNIYFDTIDFINYYDNIDGTGLRLKARIRWYGELFQFINEPILEFKKKKGLLGKKESFKLKPFLFAPDFFYRKIIQRKDIMNLPINLRLYFQKLTPILLNRYRRKYFLSACGNYRITLDSKMEYYRISNNINHICNPYKDKNNIILELKYGYEMDNNIHNITYFLPFRISRYSKYVMGINRTSNSLHMVCI